MARTVKVPDPVYDRIEREAEREDITMGMVVREWMHDSEELTEVQSRR